MDIVKYRITWILKGRKQERMIPQSEDGMGKESIGKNNKKSLFRITQAKTKGR
jgi:hypothetical protein